MCESLIIIIIIIIITETSKAPLTGISGAVQCTIIQKLKEHAKKTNKKFGLGETKKVCLELLAEAGAG